MTPRGQDGGLRATFRLHLPRFHWTSVETTGTDAGVPDSNYCLGGVEGWVEFKKTGAWSLSLAPAQVGWHLRRVRAGGKVMIATRRLHAGGARLGLPVDELWLHAGGDAGRLQAGGLRGAPPVLMCSGGPAKWDWSAVEWCLMGGVCRA